MSGKSRRFPHGFGCTSQRSWRSSHGIDSPSLGDPPHSRGLKPPVPTRNPRGSDCQCMRAEADCQCKGGESTINPMSAALVYRLHQQLPRIRSTMPLTAGSAKLPLVGVFALALAGITNDLGRDASSRSEVTSSESTLYGRKDYSSSSSTELHWDPPARSHAHRQNPGPLVEQAGVPHPPCSRQRSPHGDVECPYRIPDRDSRRPATTTTIAGRSRIAPCARHHLAPPNPTSPMAGEHRPCFRTLFPLGYSHSRTAS